RTASPRSAKKQAPTSSTGKDFHASESSVLGLRRRRWLYPLPGLAAFVASVCAARPLARERTVRVDIHHHDCGSAFGQTCDRQNVANDFAHADLLSVIPFQFESAGRGQGDVDDAGAGVGLAIRVGPGDDI